MDWAQTLVGLIVYAVVKWWWVPVWLGFVVWFAIMAQGWANRYREARAARLEEEREFQRSLMQPVILAIRDLAKDLVDPDALAARRQAHLNAELRATDEALERALAEIQEALRDRTESGEEE